MKFSKWSVQGNDFIIVDASNWPPPLAEEQAFITALCRRRTGVGADGLAVVSTNPNGRFMRFFSCDGSEADMCGNCASCVAAHAAWPAEDVRSGRVLTRATVMEYETSGDRVKLLFSGLLRPEPRSDIPRLENELDIYLGHAGVDHLVVIVHDMKLVSVQKRGRQLREHKTLTPTGGANVQFVSPRDRDGLDFDILTYEKGVEGETYACGSGAVAAALVLWNLGHAKATDIAFHGRGGKVVSHVRLDETGPVLTVAPRLVFNGDFCGFADSNHR